MHSCVQCDHKSLLQIHFFLLLFFELNVFRNWCVIHLYLYSILITITVISFNSRTVLFGFILKINKFILLGIGWATVWAVFCIWQWTAEPCWPRSPPFRAISAVWVSATNKSHDNRRMCPIHKSLILVLEAIGDAKDDNDKPIAIKDIEKFILIGGSSRIPKITELLMNTFKHADIHISGNPDTIVAHGAAIQGAILKGVHSVYFIQLDV